jgi:hypothetical protein
VGRAIPDDPAGRAGYVHCGQVLQVCEGGVRFLTTYWAAVAWLTSMPSVSNSPWMRAAPQRGLARLIPRIKSRRSGDREGATISCSTPPSQYRRKPWRYQSEDSFEFHNAQGRAAIGPNYGDPTLREGGRKFAIAGDGLGSSAASGGADNGLQGSQPAEQPEFEDSHGAIGAGKRGGANIPLRPTTASPQVQRLR